MTMNITYSSGLLGVTAAGTFFISIVGTSGNLLAIISLMQSTTLRQSPSTAFMVNLPVCLLPVCALGMPMFGIGCLQQQHFGKVCFPENFIVAAFALCLTLSQVHLHSICALAFNRLLAVMWPTRYKQLMQQRKVRVYLGLLWIYSALLWLPLAFGALGGLKYDPDELMVSMDDSQGRVWKALHVFFTFMLPILFAGTCYIAMYIKVRYSRKSRQTRALRKSMMTGDDDAVRQWDDHVTRTILVIFVFMVSCCVPHLVVHMRHLYQRDPNAWLLLHLVFWLQFCLDPLVYVIVSCQYRAACGETAKKLMQCLGLMRALEPRPSTSSQLNTVCLKEGVKPKQMVHFDRENMSQDVSV